LRSAVTLLAVVAALSLTALSVASLGGTNIPRTMLRTVSIGVATMLLTFIGGSLLG
jgi:vacuolar iron transporter family protein